MPIRMISGYQYPQWVPSWGEGWLWTPLQNSNAGTYSTTTPSVSYESSQWGLGDFIVGKETNKTLQSLGYAAIAVAAIYFFKGAGK